MAARDRQALGLLVITILLGLLLRGAGLGWGLPDARHPLATFHPDELINLTAAQAADIPHGSLDIGFYNYGAFYFYLVSFAHTFGHGWGLIPAVPNGVSPLGPAAAPSQAALFLAGRLVTLLLGAGTIPVLYALGRRLFGRKAGLLAALIYAVTPLAVLHAHFMTVDVPAAFFVSLALLWAARLLERQTWGDYVLAGVWAGLAAATKYNAGLVLIAPLIAHRCNRNPKACETHRVAHLFVLLVAAGFAFIIGCPGPIINWNAFWNGTYPGSGVRYELFEHSREGHGSLFTDTGSGWLYHLTHSLNYGMGTPLLILALLGVAYALWKRTPQDAVLLSFLLLYYVLTGFSAVRFARYMISLLPVLSLFAARIVTAAYPQRIISSVKFALAAVIIFATFAHASLFVLDMLHRDPRDTAADYLEHHAPQGAQVAFARVPWFDMPPLSPLFGAPAAPVRAKSAEQTTRFRLLIPAAEWDTSVLSPAPDYLILSDFETADALDRLHLPVPVHFMDAARRTFPARPLVITPLVPIPGLPEDMRYARPTLTLYHK